MCGVQVKVQYEIRDNGRDASAVVECNENNLKCNVHRVSQYSRHTPVDTNVKDTRITNIHSPVEPGDGAVVDLHLLEHVSAGGQVGQGLHLVHSWGGGVWCRWNGV